MKIRYLTSLIFISTLSLAIDKSIAKPIDLNQENLTLLALKYSSSEVITEYARYSLKSKHPKQYFQALKNKSQMQELIDVETATLNQRLLEVPKQQTFRMTKEVNFAITDNNQFLIQIKSLYPHIYESVFRSYDINKGLPDYFNLLIANLEILNKIKLEKKDMDYLNQFNVKKLFADVVIEVLNYQNQHEFQTVIKRIDLYANKNKKVLLTTLKESKNTDEIINNWLLSDGFTTDLAGIHAFSVLGYRLQDAIRKHYVLNNTCEKAEKIAKHQVLFCKHGYTESSMILATYIGGVLSQIDLIAKNNIDHLQSNKIIMSLRNGLKKPQTFFNASTQKWNKYFVDFSYYPEALNLSKKNKVSKKGNNLDQYQYNLVFSMSSQATQKIFEEN